MAPQLEPERGTDVSPGAEGGTAEGGPDAFSAEQRAAVGARQIDQDRTLAAVHQLEAALAAAAPRRQQPWRADVVAALALLDKATEEEDRNAEDPASLLSDIARTQPRLRTRVRGLRAQYRNLRSATATLLAELDAADDNEFDFADVRQRLAWLLDALRHQRARESDLIYEAYYEAFNRDMEQDLLDRP